MAKRLRASYELRPETIIHMMHQAYVMGFITAVGAQDGADSDDPIPIGNDDEAMKLWVEQKAETLKNMRRRRDGTYYVPEARKAAGA